MSEVLASLPIVGVDGTLKQRQSHAQAHLKTGSLKDVNAIAGIVQDRKQRRHILVAIINDPKAKEGQVVLEGLIQWVANQ
jgi:D-alanyl-D-alanine carboxypeptidase/D-alanyl-D-alanine-endopeptidase (penicillin-binding protein 4)